jgi:dUTP pyrophosphatase
MSSTPPITVGLHVLSSNAAPPAYQSPGAAAVDLAAAEDVTIPARGLVAVPTGLVFAVPAGHFLAIVARSSLPKRGLLVANGLGVLDSDYRGPADEARVLVLNYTDTPVRIAAGDRIAQAFIVTAPRVVFEPYTPAKAPSRGGFGSTGHR